MELGKGNNSTSASAGSGPNKTLLKKMMKCKNILEQEEEFLKLNAEIDSKTKELMSQVDQIKEVQLNDEKTIWNGTELPMQVESEMENQISLLDKSCEEEEDEYLSKRNDVKLENSDEIIEMDSKKGKRSAKSSHSSKLTPSLVSVQVQESAFSLGITRHKSDAKLRQGRMDSDVIPDTLKGVGHEGIMKFLSAKVKLLTEQLQVIQRDEKKYLEKIKELQVHKDKSVEERDKLLHQTNMTKNMLVKLEQHCNNVTAQLQSAQAENCHLKKELEALRREMRQNSKTHGANEIKLNRSLEEIERLKAALQQSKQEEKEFRETQRKKAEDMSNTIKNLDRQRTELLTGFKKQLLIIDNLKRQKGLIEAGKLLKSAEDDFISYLDCNPPNTVRHTDAIKSAKS